MSQQGQEIIGGRNWRGLNKSLAPHLLDETESPSCMNVAASLDVQGILGARRGRKQTYNRASNIKGVISCRFAIGQYLIVATADGTLRPENNFPSGGPAFVASTFTQSYLTNLSCALGLLGQTAKTITVSQGLIQSVV